MRPKPGTDTRGRRLGDVARHLRIQPLIVSLAGVALALAACSAGGGPPSPSASSLPSEPIGSTSPGPFVTAPPSLGPHAGLAGRVLAGPTCPVERYPPDPACAPRAVVGAVIVISDASGHEVQRVTSGPGGIYRVQLGPGTYTLTPQPVTGLLGTAAPVQVEVTSAALGPTVDLEYDTGIR